MNKDNLPGMGVFSFNKVNGLGVHCSFDNSDKTIWR